MPHSYTWRIHMLHDSFIYSRLIDTWHHSWHTTDWYVIWLISNASLICAAHETLRCYLIHSYITRITRHDTFICAAHETLRYYLTHSYITRITRHDALICAAHETLTFHVTHSYVTRLTRYDSFICDMSWQLIHMWHDSFICDMTRSYVTWLIDMRHDWQDMTHVHVTWRLIHKWHICSFYVTWLMTHTAFIRDMTHSYVKWLTTQNSLTCYTWWRLIDMWQEWWGRYRHVQRAYSTCVNRHVLS